VLKKALSLTAPASRGSEGLLGMMKLLIFCALLSFVLPAQSMETTLIALKDPQAPRKALSKRLAGEMMDLAKSNQSPSRSTVQQFCDDLSGALLGKDITNVRASAVRKAVAGVLSGKGSTFLPANGLYEVLKGCGVEERTMQTILDRFREIGQQVRGPDDLPVRDITRK
jgi:hypothetical protein